MRYLYNIIVYLAGVWLGIYCFSYVVWLWQKRNKPGAVMTGILTSVTVFLLVWKVAIYR